MLFDDNLGFFGFTIPKEAVIKEKALSNDNVKKHTEGKEIVKVIVIKNKIVNVVVKG